MRGRLAYIDDGKKKKLNFNNIKDIVIINGDIVLWYLGCDEMHELIDIPISHVRSLEIKEDRKL